MKTHPLEKFAFCPSCGSKSLKVNNEKSKKCDDCGFVYYANVSSSVAVFIRNQEGDLLVCRRKKEPAAGTLDLPGGFVDIGETASDAVLREIKEELNLNVTKMTFFTSLPNEYTYSGMVINTLDMFFICEVENFNNMRPDDDVSEAFFMSVNTISPDDFGLNSIKRGIIAFLKGL